MMDKLDLKPLNFHKKGTSPLYLLSSKYSYLISFNYLRALELLILRSCAVFTPLFWFNLNKCGHLP